MTKEEKKRLEELETLVKVLILKVENLELGLKWTQQDLDKCINNCDSQPWY